MRSPDHSQPELFYLLDLEQLIPADHPLRQVRVRADRVLRRLQPRLARLYSHTGRPSIPPERLLRALLLQVLYGYRSERRLMQEMQYNLALRWFVGLTLADAVWDVTVFTKNRERFLSAELEQAWLKAVVLEARQEGLLDEEHFSVDGTLIQAWASERSYRPKAYPPAPGAGSGRRGERLKRDLYLSTTDPEARLYRHSQRDKFRLGYIGHAVMENGSGLIVAGMVTEAHARAERSAGRELMQRVRQLFRGAGGKRKVSVGADKAFHERDFVEAMRRLNVEPHLGAYQCARADLVGERLRKTKRYQESQKRRRWIERCFAWVKGPGGQRQTRFRGRRRVSWMFTFALGVYNLLRLTRLAPA